MKINRLRRERHMYNISLRELEEMTGIPSNTIRQYEQQTTKKLSSVATYDDFEALMKAFNLTKDEMNEVSEAKLIEKNMYVKSGRKYVNKIKI